MLPHGRSSLYAGASGSSPRKRAGVFPAHETSWRFRVTPVSGSTVDLSIDEPSIAPDWRIRQPHLAGLPTVHST